MKIDKKILGVITARGGSKGIPGKNIKLLNGKPLIAYTIEAARKSELLTRCIVSTDDENIAAVCREYGADVPFMRPKELAQDDTPHLPVMKHAIEYMEKILGVVFDIAVILQPTSPFRAKDDIDGTIRKLIETDADSSVSICEVESNAHPMKVKKFDGCLILPYAIDETTMRRQDLPKAYKRSSAVYAVKRDVILKENRLCFDGRVAGYVVSSEHSIDIDTPFDWFKAEWMLNDLKKKGFEF